jgi:hypothetical protein
MDPSRRICGVLVLLTLGSFVAYYTALRWQSIGLTRLMLSCVIVGAPLSAVLFERVWCRYAAIAVLFVSIVIYSTYGFGLAIRRLDWSGRSRLAARIASLQRDHGLDVEYQWQGEASANLRLREDYTRREVYQLFFSRVTQPVTVGFVAPFFGEGYYAFGSSLSNKVYSLADSRRPEQVRQPPPDVKYVLVVDYTAATNLAAGVLADFRPWFEARSSGVPFFTAYRREQREGP